MDVGLFMMPLHPPGKPLTQCYDEDIELIVRAEELGFTEAWIGEHATMAWENIPANDLFIATLLPRTSRIRLGTGVVLLPQHHPANVANRIAMLDHLSRGRILFGAGQSGVPTDNELFALPPGRQQGMMMLEAIDLILRLWRSEAPFDLHGEHWRLKVERPLPHIGLGNVIRPYQQPHPPIAMGLMQAQSLGARTCGERDWIPISTNLVPIAAVANHWELYQAGARDAGRPAPSRTIWRICRNVFVGETTEAAWEFARRGSLGQSFSDYFIPMFQAGNRLGLMKTDPDLPDEAIDADYCLRNLCVVGDPDACVRQLRAIWDQTGGFGTLLMITHDWDDRARWLRSMELLANEVIPALPSAT